MTLNRQLGFGFALLAAVLLLESFTPLDTAVQKLFYDAAKGEWLINRASHQRLSIIFYKGIKNLVIACGVGALIMFGLSFGVMGLRRWRKPALLLSLSIILVPAIVAGSKQLTNVYCPDQLAIYGGDYPQAGVLEKYPAGFVQSKRGKCFPAGHATVGFSLMMLYFCFERQRAKIAALTSAVALGWITGSYQMLRGEHFISHTIFTMIASWMVIVLIYATVNRICKKC